MPEPSRLWTALEFAKKLTETRETLIKADSLLERIDFAKGGTNEPSNFAPAHLTCNIRKQAQRTHLI